MNSTCEFQIASSDTVVQLCPLCCPEVCPDTTQEADLRFFAAERIPLLQHVRSLKVPGMEPFSVASLNKVLDRLNPAIFQELQLTSLLLCGPELSLSRLTGLTSLRLPGVYVESKAKPKGVRTLL